MLLNSQTSTLTFDKLEDLAVDWVENFYLPTAVWFNPETLLEMTKSYFASNRISSFPTGGYQILKYRTCLGDLDIRSSIIVPKDLFFVGENIHQAKHDMLNKAFEEEVFGIKHD